MQKFTPIDVTVTEICVTVQIERKIERITADLISDKSHNSVAFVHGNNYLTKSMLYIHSFVAFLPRDGYA